MNRPAKGWSPRWGFFAIRTADATGVEAKALEGPIDPVLFEEAEGATVPSHSLPRFQDSEFLAAYPFGQVVLTDPGLPVGVRLQAFNPLAPTDPDASGMPIAVLRYIASNPSETSVEVSTAGNVQNFIGTDGTNGEPKAGRNTPTRHGELGIGRRRDWLRLRRHHQDTAVRRISHTGAMVLIQWLRLGVFAQHPDTTGAKIELTVLGGQLAVHTPELTGAGTAELGTRALTKGERVEARVGRDASVHATL